MRRLLPPLLVVLLPTVALSQGDRGQQRRKVPPTPTLEELQAEFAALADSGYPQQITALRKLGRVKTAPCVRFLERLVQSSGTEPRVRLEALRVIGQVGVDPAAEVLGRFLAGDTKTLRPMALSGLSRIRPQIEPAPFLAALTQTDASLRMQAIAALGNYAQVPVAEALTRALTEPALPRTLRTPVLRSLARVVVPDPVRAWLRETALDPKGPYGAAFADLLHLAGVQKNASGQLRESIYPHLRSRDPQVRSAAADALGQLLKGKASLAEHSLDELRPLLRDPDSGVVFSAGVAIGEIVPVGETLEVILSLCRSKSAAMRALALVALERSGDARVVPAAAKALSDKSHSVRAAGVATLSAHRTRAAITALVQGLKKNKKGRLNHELLAALRKLTRANPGPLYTDWKRWWSEVEDDFRLPKTGSLLASARRPTQTATRGVPTYYGSEVVSRRVAFIVDVSGSMTVQVKGKDGESSSRIELCKQELKGVIAALPKRAYFNVMWFSNTFTTWRAQLTPAGKRQKRSALQAVSALKAGGGTNIFDSLEAALKDPDIDTIYLLSDGAPSSGRIVDPASILREVRKLNVARQVAIHTISIGSQSAFMRDLAREHAGQAISR